MKKMTIRRQPAVLVAGAVGSLALALSTNGTLSAFTASIQNTTNTAATGYVAMKETLLDVNGAPTGTACTDGSSTAIATGSAICSTINKYGGTAVPLAPTSAPVVTKISIQNTGTVAASAFSLLAGACTQTAQTPNGGATDVCSHFLVKIDSGSTSIVAQKSLAALAAGGTVDIKAALGGAAIAPNATIPLTITVSMDPNAGNAYAGFIVSQPLTWTFTA